MRRGYGTGDHGTLADHHAGVATLVTPQPENHDPADRANAATRIGPSQVPPFAISTKPTTRPMSVSRATRTSRTGRCQEVASPASSPSEKG
jgi:hypothetical protein